MWFNNKSSLNSYPEFGEHVNQIFGKKRASEMNPASFKKISAYMEKYSTTNEASYFGGLIDSIIKSERTIETRKRNAEGEILFVCQSFEEDDMIRLPDVIFDKGFLPGKMNEKSDNQLGLTDPKPDWTFGIQCNQYPLPGASPSDTVKGIIGIADGMIHPFFIIESKRPDVSIDVARNQAIRDGACIVNARFRLNAMAQDEGSDTPKGADKNSFTFSCTWDTTISEIWVHWHETLEGGGELFHMNLLSRYVMDRSGELTQFRHDVHDILDWGTLTHRRQCEEVVQKIMDKAKHGKQSGKTGSGRKTSKQSGKNARSRSGKSNMKTAAGLK